MVFVKFLVCCVKPSSVKRDPVLICVHSESVRTDTGLCSGERLAVVL